MPKSAFALDHGTGWYRKTSGSHHWKSYYHTSLPIRLIFTHAHLLTLGPQHSFLPNSWYVRLNTSNNLPISKDIWEGYSWIKWYSGRIKGCKWKSTQLRNDVQNLSEEKCLKDLIFPKSQSQASGKSWVNVVKYSKFLFPVLSWRISMDMGIPPKGAREKRTKNLSIKRDKISQCFLEEFFALGKWIELQ